MTNDEIAAALTPIVRQLERLEERTRDIVTRADLEILRKELVARAVAEQVTIALKDQIIRVDSDRVEDKRLIEERVKKIEEEQISRQDRFWIRIGQVVAIAAFALAMVQLVTRVKFLP